MLDAIDRTFKVGWLAAYYGSEYNLAESTMPFAVAAKTMRALLAYGET